MSTATTASNWHGDRCRKCAIPLRTGERYNRTLCIPCAGLRLYDYIADLHKRETAGEATHER